MAVDVQGVFDLLARYGYAIVFVAAMAEALPLLGLLVPGQAVVTIAGAVAATGRLNVVVLILIAVPAGVLGDAVAYYLGRHYGRPFLERFGARLRIEERHLRRSDQLFDKYGPFALVLGRFSFLTRGVIPLLAGASRLRPAVFWAINLLGAVAWAVAYAMLGYAFGTSYRYLEQMLGRILAVTAVSVAGLYLLYRFLRRYAHQFTREDLAIVLLGIWGGTAFGLVADAVSDAGSANALDARQGAFHALLAPAAPLLGLVARAWSLPLVAAASIALLAWLAFRRRPWEAGLVGFGVGGILLLVGILRPLLIPLDDHAAFPSSHAASGVVLAGIGVYLVALRARRAATAWAAIGAGALLALLVGLAPLAAAAERPSDVAGGFALGVAWLSLSLLIVEFGFKHDPLPARGDGS